MAVVVLRRALLLALACSLVSCDSLFDSFYPASIEYLETQTDLVAQMGGKPVTSIRMRYLAATPFRAGDLLVVTASTRDGDSHVVFYDPATLAVKKAYGGAELRAVNLGQNPATGLFAQDELYVYTGEIKYDAGLSIVDADSLAAYFETLPTPQIDAYRVTYDDSDNLRLFSRDNARVSAEVSSTFDLYSSAPQPISPAFPYPNSTMLDAVYWAGRHYGIVTGVGDVYLVNGPDPTSWVPAAGPVTVFPESFENPPGESAWATAQAAILRTRGDNTVRLTAYSWSGDLLGSVSMPDDRKTVAYCFDPGGRSWYLFESSTGKLSRQKPWW